MTGIIIVVTSVITAPSMPSPILTHIANSLAVNSVPEKLIAVPIVPPVKASSLICILETLP